MNYDEHPIEAYTGYSYRELRDFQRRHVTAVRAGVLVLWCVLLFVISIPVTIVDLVSGYGIYVLWENMMLYLFTILNFLLWMSLGGVFYTKNQYLRATQMVRNGQSYTFCENDFAMRNEQPDAIGQARVAYSILDRVIETPDMFYLYINRRQAYLVSKTDLRGGTPEELRALLLRFVPKNRLKYKR